MQCARLQELAVVWESQLQRAEGGIQELEQNNVYYAHQRHQLSSQMAAEQRRFEPDSPTLQRKYAAAAALLAALR